MNNKHHERFQKKDRIKDISYQIYDKTTYNKKQHRSMCIAIKYIVKKKTIHNKGQHITSNTYEQQTSREIPKKRHYITIMIKNKTKNETKIK